MEDWKNKHSETIESFLAYLNQKTEKFILKGGTALLACYNLDRFSEDIDLDGKAKSIEEIVKSFCNQNNFTYRIAKDTEIVKRYMINYGNNQRPLKVEVSYRKRNISQDEITKINGINVYNINSICIMKINAYSQRDKIRDLYDISYIYNNFSSQLSKETILSLQNALEYKGLEHFDYIVRTQNDELINNEKLSSDFLNMLDKIGLLYENEYAEKFKDEEIEL